MIATSIMIVEDEGLVALALEEQLQRLGYIVTGVAASGKQALRLAESSQPQLSIMDIRIQGEMDGITTALELRRRFDMPVLFATAHAEDVTLARAREANPLGYLVKPVTARDLHGSIQVALHRFSSERIQRQEGSWVRRLLNCMGTGVIVLDMQGRVQFMNSIAGVLSGCTPTAVVGMQASDVLQFCTSDGQPIPSAVDLMLASGGGVPLPPNTLLAGRKSQATPIEDCATPITDESGMPVGLMLILHDVSEQRTARNALEASLMQLTTRCRDLECVSHKAARDIQEPLTLMSRLAGMLVENTGETVTQAVSHARDIQSTASQATQVMSRLADLSTATCAPISKEYVDLSAMARSVTERLTATVFSERSVIVSVEPELPCFSDPRLLRLALENLFITVVHSMDPNTPALIEFGLSPQADGGQTFFMRDISSAPLVMAAAGASSAVARFHTDPRSYAQGVGYATFTRVITRLGGKVWADNSEAARLALYFTIPTDA